MAKGTPIYGDEFRKIREQLFLTQSAMALKLGISTGGVQRIEGRHIASVSFKTLLSLAELTKATPEGILARIKAPQDVADAIAAEEAAAGNQSQSQRQVLDQIVSLDGADEEPTTEFDNNVDPYSEQKFFEIPLFDLSVSAGGWTDVMEVGEIQESQSMAQGRFRIRIAGDSMETDPPDKGFMNRSIVEFVCIRFEHQIIEVGRHYYIQKDDGMATFKTIKKMNAETLTLGALNKKKYPKPLSVQRREIVRIAVAESKIILV